MMSRLHFRVKHNILPDVQYAIYLFTGHTHVQRVEQLTLDP